MREVKFSIFVIWEAEWASVIFAEAVAAIDFQVDCVIFRGGRASHGKRTFERQAGQNRHENTLDHIHPRHSRRTIYVLLYSIRAQKGGLGMGNEARTQQQKMKCKK